MTVTSNLDQFLKRINARADRLGASSESKQRLLVRIGTRLSSAMVMNATRERIVDTGALRQSIKYRVDGDSVEVGTFGVPYAKYHEFGANLGVRGLRAMGAALRARHSPKVRSKIRDKNVVMKGGMLRARPFVRPAFQKNIARISQEIKDWLNGD